MSERAQKILALLGTERILPIRQQSLAEQLGCSRRSIGRALKELKAAGLLVDLNKRHENRCKLYQVVDSSLRSALALKQSTESWIAASATPPCNDEITRHAQIQWERYEKTFRIVFESPDLDEQYARVTHELRHVTGEMDLWRKTWSGLRAVYGRELSA